MNLKIIMLGERSQTKNAYYIIRHASKCKVKGNRQWLPGKYNGELPKAIRKLLGITDMLSILIVAIVSQAYTHVKAYQIANFSICIIYNIYQ